MNVHENYDVLVIGSGCAGLSLALRLPENFKVAVISKAQLNEGSTFYAQGGIAAVMADEDTLEGHINDTLKSGCGLSNPKIVRQTVQRARECIDWLVTHGVKFSEDNSKHFHLTQEGGHSHRRVLHAADKTGQEIETTLCSLVNKQKNIHVYTHYLAVDLIKDQDLITGAYVFNTTLEQVEVLQAKIIVLATGGSSKVYLYTSNPDVASGDGIAMAWRAGCQVANLEFNQFHPTCLYHPKAKSFLISEALRGEGAKITLPTGESFLHEFDERGELATRDIVARAIDNKMKRLGIDHVNLDISHKSTDFIYTHFPTIYAKCLSLGLDITKHPIPVVPAAHYTCGGVVTNKHGLTNIKNLYAVGEVAYTGLHGANRMASNSLLECLVFAAYASEHIIENIGQFKLPTKPKAWDESRVIDSDEEIVVTHNWQELRRMMWNYVGIVRTNKRLQRAARRLALLKEEIQEYYSHFRVSKDLLELRNLVVVADLMVKSASSRHESRGLHYNMDFPEINPSLDNQPTVLNSDYK